MSDLIGTRDLLVGTGVDWHADIHDAYTECHNGNAAHLQRGISEATIMFSQPQQVVCNLATTIATIPMTIMTPGRNTVSSKVCPVV